MLSEDMIARRLAVEHKVHLVCTPSSMRRLMCTVDTSMQWQVMVSVATADQCLDPSLAQLSRAPGTLRKPAQSTGDQKPGENSGVKQSTTSPPPPPPPSSSTPANPIDPNSTRIVFIDKRLPEVQLKVSDRNTAFCKSAIRALLVDYSNSKGFQLYIATYILMFITLY